MCWRRLRAAMRGRRWRPPSGRRLQWHPTVQASRREEQALWRQFRAACDAVFARRQAEQREADVERQINLARKTALCEELEGLTAGDSAAFGEARTRVQEAQAVWTAAGPVPRGTYKALEQALCRGLRAARGARARPGKGAAGGGNARPASAGVAVRAARGPAGGAGTRGSGGGGGAAPVGNFGAMANGLDEDPPAALRCSLSGVARRGGDAAVSGTAPGSKSRTQADVVPAYGDPGGCGIARGIRPGADGTADFPAYPTR